MLLDSCQILCVLALIFVLLYYVRMNNRSKAAIIRWSKVDPKKRSEIARNAVTKRWEKTSTKERKRHAMKMVKARTRNV